MADPGEEAQQSEATTGGPVPPAPATSLLDERDYLDWLENQSQPTAGSQRGLRVFLMFVIGISAGVAGVGYVLLSW